jgi:hypothetical protein
MRIGRRRGPPAGWRWVAPLRACWFCLDCDGVFSLPGPRGVHTSAHADVCPGCGSAATVPLSTFLTGPAWRIEAGSLIRVRAGA